MNKNAVHRMMTFALAAALCAISAAGAAEPATEPSASPQPEYPVPYARPAVAQIKATLLEIRQELDRSCPLPPTPGHIRSGFNPLGYPMGVAYAGLLDAANATGDESFSHDLAARLQFFADYLAHQKPPASEPTTEPGMKLAPEPGPISFRHLTNPHALDDCGAIGAAFIKARRANVGPDLLPTINRFADYVSTGQFRLVDGTVARNSPFKNSIWADDMYMSVPLLAQMGALTGKISYIDDAAKQVQQIGDKLYVPEKGLFTHAWNAQTGAFDQPHYFWGRANGWCMMAMVELLEVMPTDHPQREPVRRLLRELARGVASVQSGTGLWHQLLDQNDSYLETSCTAMFTFAIARGVNRGWLDAGAYTPVAIAGWNGLATRVSRDGQITGTCIGTSYADDPIYYAHRPAVDDVHAYGPTLMAGSEMIRLLQNPHVRIEGGQRGSPLMVREKR